ncbi:MAG: hypothetical protein ABIV47_25530 [Roseiflexaceae bacterium]
MPNFNNLDLIARRSGSNSVLSRAGWPGTPQDSSCGVQRDPRPSHLSAA